MTTVVNIKTREPFDVYIGRASPRARDTRCHVSGEWCNPFRVHRGTTRKAVLRRYERMIRKYLDLHPDAWGRLLALRGKRLGCWCSPQPCHGDVLVGLIEEAWEKQNAEGAEGDAEVAEQGRGREGAVAQREDSEVSP